MKTVLEDIKGRILRGAYRNEEHVRVCIVLRILQALGWDIWNPNEVNLEFPVLPNEDQTRIDVALFLSPHEPSVFVEVKALGKLESSLNQAERQLRDYNRDNQALFSIITDGQTWRFYHSAARGEFANRCFKILNLTESNPEDLEQGFAVFLSKVAVETGNSEREATTYLQLSREQRAMEDALPEARRLVLESPYPSLPEALVQVVRQAGIAISLDKATKFIQRSPPPRPVSEQVRADRIYDSRTERLPAGESSDRQYAPDDDRIDMRWFDKAILRSVAESGGRASAQEANDRIERMMRTEGKLPSEYWEAREAGGLTRWKHRVAARRYSLVQRGCLSDRSARGIWELTEKGRRAVRPN